MLTLKTYIEQLGDEVAAEVLGISARAARSYREGLRKPRPDAAKEMVKRSRGKLTLEGIYSPPGAR